MFLPLKLCNMFCLCEGAKRSCKGPAAAVPSQGITVYCEFTDRVAGEKRGKQFLIGVQI